MNGKIEPGNVVFVLAHYGSSTKLRPAVVIESDDSSVYVLLGSTKNLLNEPQTVVVSTEHDLKAMGLKYHTQFRWGCGGDQRVSLNNVQRVVGVAPEAVTNMIGQAWANAKFSRII